MEQITQYQAAAPKTSARYSPPDYIIDTYTDEAGLRATMVDMLPPFFATGYLVLSIILLILGIYMLTPPPMPIVGVISIAIAIQAMMYRVWLPRKTVSTQLEKLQQAFGTDTVPSRLVFWPQGVAMTNNLTNTAVNLRYERIQMISNKKDYVGLRTQEGEIILVRMQDVPGDGFLNYLVRHCPKAKTRGIRQNEVRKSDRRSGTNG